MCLKKRIFVHSAGDTKAGAFPDQPDEYFFIGFTLKFHLAVWLSRLFWLMLKSAKGITFIVVGSIKAALAK